MGVLIAILTAVLAFIASIAGNLIASDIYDRFGSLARWIKDRAVWRLKVDQRPHYHKEWSVDLEEHDGGIEKVHRALSYHRAVAGLNQTASRKALRLRPSTLTFANGELVPDKLRSLTPQDTQNFIRYLYSGEFKSLHDRDISALAAARLIHYNLANFDARESLDCLLTLTLDRLRSFEEGGRSITLGALASLVRPCLNLQFDPAFVDNLEESAALAIRCRTFFIPEFGLLIAGTLHELFPKRDSVRSLLDDLIDEVQANPQNERVLGVANSVRAWMPRRKTVPIESLFSGGSDGRLEHQIVRPLTKSSPIFSNWDETMRAAARIAGHGLLGASDEEVRLYDHLVRLKSGELLHKIS